jgi:uncharacterized protein (DUF305 family)
MNQMQLDRMMEQMPEQCRVAMHQIMAPMMQGGLMPGGQSAAARGYAAAVDKMHAPMMKGIADADPDAAFVKGMIPHHQSAIDMARVALQYAKDDQVKKWARDVIREQEREIGEMQTWLKKHGH